MSMSYNTEEIIHTALKEVYGTTWDEMMGIRKAKYFDAKWACVFLYVEAGQKTLTEGAERFSLVSHSAVHHALLRCKKLYAKNKAFKDKFDEAANLFPEYIRDYILARVVIGTETSRRKDKFQTNVVRAYTRVPIGEEPVAYLRSIKFDIENGCFEGRRRKGISEQLKSTIVKSIDTEISKYERS